MSYYISSHLRYTGKKLNSHSTSEMEAQYLSTVLGNFIIG